MQDMGAVVGAVVPPVRLVDQSRTASLRIAQAASMHPIVGGQGDGRRDRRDRRDRLEIGAHAGSCAQPSLVPSAPRGRHKLRRVREPAHLENLASRGGGGRFNRRETRSVPPDDRVPRRVVMFAARALLHRMRDLQPGTSALRVRLCLHHSLE